MWSIPDGFGGSSGGKTEEKPLLFPVESPESRKAFDAVRDYILANLPQGCLDRAAFQLIDRRQEEIDRAISEMCGTAEAQILAGNPSLSASLAFSIPFVAGVMIRERLREIESQRGYA